MFEENYSYSVIAEKLGSSKSWVSEWTRRWKSNFAESLQSQSFQRLTKITALNLTAQRIICKSKYQLVEMQPWTLHSTVRLARKFTKFVSD